MTPTRREAILALQRLYMNDPRQEEADEDVMLVGNWIMSLKESSSDTTDVLPNYTAAHEVYRKTTAFWAPELIDSPDHFEKLFDAMHHAAFPHAPDVSP